MKFTVVGFGEDDGMWRSLALGSAVLVALAGCGIDSPTVGSETLVVVDEDVGNGGESVENAEGDGGEDEVGENGDGSSEVDDDGGENGGDGVGSAEVGSGDGGDSVENGEDDVGDGGDGVEVGSGDGGESVEVGVGENVEDGDGEGGESAVDGESICPTDVSDDYGIPASIESYAREYSLSMEESRRRLACITPIKEVLAEIAEHEGFRLAGMGIGHGDDFGGWVLLSGDEPPGQEAARIANSAVEVKIQTGAGSTYEELKAAVWWVGSREWKHQVLEDSEDSGWDSSEAWSMLNLISGYGIDQSKNILTIDIDPGRNPKLRDNSGSKWVSDDVLEETAARMTDFLRDHIDVDFEVGDGRGFSLD